MLARAPTSKLKFTTMAVLCVEKLSFERERERSEKSLHRLELANLVALQDGVCIGTSSGRQSRTNVARASWKFP